MLPGQAMAATLMLKDVQNMRKEEVARHLMERAGEEPDRTWTAIELKERLKELVRLESDPSGKLLRGMASAKKHELQERCTQAGVTFTIHHTKPRLKAKLRQRAYLSKALNGKDLPPHLDLKPL